MDSHEEITGTTQDQSEAGNEPQVSPEHAQNQDAVEEDKRPPVSPTDTEPVDLKSPQSLEGATPADGQFKCHTSPTHLQPQPRLSPADSVELISDIEGYVVSIPLLLVRLSRRSKSRSSSKDYGGKSHNSSFSLATC